MKPNTYATVDASEHSAPETPWIDSNFEAICKHLLNVPLFQRGQFLISDAEIVRAAQGLHYGPNACLAQKCDIEHQT